MFKSWLIGWLICVFKDYNPPIDLIERISQNQGRKQNFSAGGDGEYQNYSFLFFFFAFPGCNWALDKKHAPLTPPPLPHFLRP